MPPAGILNHAMPAIAAPKRKSSRPAPASSFLAALGLKAENPGAFCGEWMGSGKLLDSVSPIDGRVLASVRTSTPDECERVLRRAQEAFQKWQTVPAPKRGELIRQLGNALREAKKDLGRLVTLEA